MTGLTVATFVGILAIVLLAFAPPLVLFIVALVCGLITFLFLLGLCMAARAGDEIFERARREAMQERKARSQIYGGTGGFRVR